MIGKWVSLLSNYTCAYVGESDKEDYGHFSVIDIKKN